MRQMHLWVVFSLLYFSAALTSTFTKELWFDELVSVYVDRLPDLGSVWRALADSADAMPPLFHIATRASHAAISDEATAARLPGAIGYWVACLSAWIFLRRRMSAAYAWCAVAVMLLPAPFYFATEGRAYGMVLGFSGLMLLCWQRCIGAGRRLWHPLGLAVFLCCAVSSHYFAVFLTIPLSLAEFYRMGNAHRGWKRCDWPVLAAIGSVFTPLVFHLPLIRAADIYRADTLAAPKLTDGFRFYSDIISGVGPALGAALVAAAVMMWWKPEETHDAEPEGLRPAELVMTIGFLLIPLAVLASSLLITGMFYPRYGLAAMFGLMFTAAELLRRLCPRRRAVAAAFSGVFLLVAGAQRGLDIASNWKQLPTAKEMAETARLTNGPVVVEEAFAYIRAFYYAPPELASRLWYVPDAKAAMASIGLGNPDIGLEKLRSQAATFNLGSRERFLEQPGTFYLLIDPLRLGWLLGELERTQARVELSARLPRHWLMKVTR
jgi:hypothetical protein